MIKNNIDYTLLFTYIILGFILVLLYIKMYVKSTNNQLDDFWSNKNKNKILKSKHFKNFYIFMIFLSSISGLYLIYYLSTVNKTNNKSKSKSKTLIYIGSFMLLLFSIMWAYNPFYYPVISLFGVFIGSLLIFIGIYKNNNIMDNEKIVALIASFILMFQTGLFDLIIWNGFI